jgi:hypothetical protein
MQVRCAVCAKIVAEEESVAFEGSHICASCKPGYFQKLREGALPRPSADPVSFQRRMLGLLAHASWCGMLQVAGFYGIANLMDQPGYRNGQISGWIPGCLNLVVAFAAALLLLKVMSLRLRCTMRELPGRLLLPNVLLMALVFLLGGISCAVTIVSSSQSGMGPGPLVLIMLIPFLYAVLLFEILILSFVLLLVLLAWGKFRPVQGA